MISVRGILMAITVTQVAQKNQRETEREREHKKSCYINLLLIFKKRRNTPFYIQVPIPAGTMQPNTSMADRRQLRIFFTLSQEESLDEILTFDTIPYNHTKLNIKNFVLHLYLSPYPTIIANTLQ